MSKATGLTKEFLETRDDAISWLCELGFHARARDWAPGKTISVAASRILWEDTDIVAYRHLLYLIPAESGWEVVDFEQARPKVIACSSLAEAASEAVVLLRTKLAGDAGSESHSES